MKPRSAGHLYVRLQTMRPLILIFVALIGLLYGESGETSPQGKTFLRLYIVSTQAIAGGRFIDTADFPRLGYIEAVPALELQRLAEITLANQASQSETTIHIKMFPEDAKRFAAVTERAVGKQILLMLGSEPLMAPRLLTPISGPYLQLGLNGWHNTTRIANALKALTK